MREPSSPPAVFCDPRERRPGLARFCLFLACSPFATGCSGGPSRSVPVRAFSPLPPIPAPRLLRAAGVEYRLGAGDVVSLRVFELERPGEATSLDLEVAPDGRIPVPLLGAVLASGKTAAELRDAVAGALRERFLRSPDVSVTVREYRSRRVLVVGAVARPGVYTLARGDATLVDALALAGGLSERAGLELEILRPARPAGTGGGESAGEPLRITVDLENLLDRGDLSADVPLEPGDMVWVPEAGEFSVSGFVGKPGVYPLRRRTTVLLAVSAAGGYASQRASPTAAFVRRPGPDGSVRRIPVDLEAIAEGQADDVWLEPGDHVEVPRTGFKGFLVEAWDFLRGRVGILWPGAL